MVTIAGAFIVQSLANLAPTDDSGSSASEHRKTGSSKKQRDAATSRKSESLAATRQWFALQYSRAARASAVCV